MDLSGLAGADDSQAVAALLGQPVIGDGVIGFDVDEAVGRQPGQDGRQDARQPAGPEGGVQQDQILQHGRPLVKPAGGVGADDLDAGPCPELLDAGVQATGDGGVLFDHQHAGGPARGGLEAQGAGAGEEVQAMPAGKVLPQPVEQGLAHPVGGGPQARRVGHGQQAALPLAADDANAGGHGGVLGRKPLVYRLCPLSPLCPWVPISGRLAGADRL